MRLDQIPDPALRISEGGSILSINPAASAWLGTEIVGATITIALGLPPLLALSPERWTPARLRDAAGNPIQVSLWLAPIDNAYILLLRKSAAGFEDSAEHALAQCVRLAHWPVILCHHSGHVALQNRAADILQSALNSGEDLLGSLHQVDASQGTLRNFIAGALNHSETTRVDVTTLGARPSLFTAYLVRLDMGDATPLVSITLRDVTARQSQLRKQERLQKLAFEAEERLRHAFELLPDGLAIFDQADALITANRAYLDILGVREQDIPQGTPFELIAREAAREGLANLKGQTVEDWIEALREQRSTCDHTEAIAHRPDGRWIRRVDSRASNGELVSIRADITAQKVREADLVEARRRAEAATRAKSSFLANMSHEIRTPMNGVVGMVDLLCESELDPEQREYAETIRSSADALLVIINDVLDFSKIEAERLDLFPAPFNFEQMVQDVIRILQPRAKAGKIALRLSYDDRTPRWLVGDNARIRQIVTNLAGNAVKFTEEGEVCIRISGARSIDQAGADLTVIVEDSGVGIAPENLADVFGEFTQVDMTQTRRFEGTGLGLAITKRLVEMMGGKLWAESTLGQGSTFGFRLWLPRANLFEHKNAQIAAKSPTRNVPLDRRILIAEDNKTNRLVLRKLLKNWTGPIEEAVDGGEAVEKYESFQPDLILMDVSMPVMDGVQATQAIRRIEQDNGMPSCPIIAFTANAMSGDREKYIAAGMTDYLTKPVKKAQLFEAIARQLTADKF